MSNLREQAVPLPTSKSTIPPGFRKVPDLTGKQFNRWLVLERVWVRTARRGARWLCQCSCGTKRILDTGDLRKKGWVSCGCYNRERASKLRLRPYEAMYNLLRKNAFEQGREVTLTYEDFWELAQHPECHYCGEPVEFYAVFRRWGTRKKSGYNIDRKDSSVGYTRNNCVVCCARCNFAKNKWFTYSEWVQIGALIRSWKSPNK